MRDTIYRMSEEAAPSLQKTAFGVLVEDQMQRLHSLTSRQYRIVPPGGKLTSLDGRYVGTLAEILPERARLTDVARQHASHIVVQIEGIPTDMRSMFNHACMHLLVTASMARDLVIWPGSSIADATNSMGLGDIGAIFIEVAGVKALHGDDHDPYYRLDTEDVKNGGYWVEHWGQYDEKLRTRMRQLSNEARFTLAARLWFHVARLNSEDVANIVRDRIQGDHDTRTTLHGIEYELHDGSVLHAHLPVSDQEIRASNGDPTMGVQGLAESLAREHWGEYDALVGCAMAANAMDETAARRFVNKMRAPSKKRRAEDEN